MTAEYVDILGIWPYRVRPVSYRISVSKNRKPTEKFLGWYGLRMLTASRDRSRSKCELGDECADKLNKCRCSQQGTCRHKPCRGNGSGPCHSYGHCLECGCSLHAFTTPIKGHQRCGDDRSTPWHDMTNSFCLFRLYANNNYYKSSNFATATHLSHFLTHTVYIS